MAVESAVGLHNDVGRGVIGIRMHCVGADRGPRSGKAQIENLEVDDLHEALPVLHRSNATASTLMAPVTIC